jgi:chitin synthase
MVSGEDEAKRGLLGAQDDDDSVSNMSYQTDMSTNTGAAPAHYFDPSKEAPAKAGSGYYPTYRPQSMAPTSMQNNSNIPLQPTPTAPGPWGPQQNYGSQQPHTNMHQQPSPPMGNPRGPQQQQGQMGGPQGQYVNTRPNLPPNQQGSFHGF